MRLGKIHQSIEASPILTLRHEGQPCGWPFLFQAAIIKRTHYRY